MFIAIFRLLGMVALIAVFVGWIVGIINSDGHCHLDSCDGCPYDPEECPESRRKHEREDDG